MVGRGTIAHRSPQARTPLAQGRRKNELTTDDTDKHRWERQAQLREFSRIRFRIISKPSFLSAN
jgi:hypothetical protein